jgi:hypothetical protein
MGERLTWQRRISSWVPILIAWLIAFAIGDYYGVPKGAVFAIVMTAIIADTISEAIRDPAGRASPPPALQDQQ